MADSRLTLREVALFGILGALTFGAKVAMSILPNIEPVTLMVMLYGAVFGHKGLYPLYLYVVLEILFYGIQLWSISYLYVWLVPLLGGWLLKDSDSPLVWALLAGCFGLFFGALCAPVCLFTGGLSFAVSWWVSGIPFDLMHCGGNFVIALLLFIPLRKLLRSLYASMRR